jgi:riboflavin kinase/FMN adenylyltransferase
MHRPRSVVTIGSFDGVHVGHAALVRRAREIAATKAGTRVVVMAFDPHPTTVLAPERVPARLTTFEQRAEYLGSMGADEVVRLEPSGNLLSLSPEEFLGHVVGDLAPVAIVEGDDFRFGRGRTGDVETLRRYGQAHGFSVEVVAPVEVAMTDGTLVRASSTMTRWLLEQGRIADAAAVLGRPYEMVGSVVQGDRRGREIGFPTANLRSECVAPGDGVYAGTAILDDGREFLAAISVGSKPTFGEHERAVEAFLFRAAPGSAGPAGWSAIDGLPEYDWPLRLRFEHWVRDQVAFASLPALLEQVERDCARVREMAGFKEPACR